MEKDFGDLHHISKNTQMCRLKAIAHTELEVVISLVEREMKTREDDVDLLDERGKLVSLIRRHRY